MELCKISIAFSLVVLALFNRMGAHGSIGVTQPGSTQSNVTVAVAPNPASMKNGLSPQDFLNVHNVARTVVGVCPIIWNNVVARQYTQVIGSNSSRLGCAKVIGSNNGGTFVICNYDPPSNDPICKNQSNIMVANVPNPSSTAEGSLPQNYLNVHTMARAAVGVRPITWDNVVAMSAVNYANKKILDCELMPSKGPYGENLAERKDDLSGSWINEKRNYNLKSGACNSSHICSHYTQAIWRNLVHLGCAKARCNNGGTFIVCNYDPLGKIIGKLPIDVNQSISKAILPSAASTLYFFPSKHLKRNMGGLVVGLIVGACGLIFGLVYRGHLRDLDTYVAVKRISKASKQGIKEYAFEVKIINQLRYENLVKLIS
ncbi:hypothetical protein Gogos_000441 [Gossypium gossypioides]|uniref:SCP domain-containing protein n=1 Tax=Gossypium gossypioides TaxID=34282 RepID=A0A7J9CSR2_GOSGO|nr:hypothetical protein [Gossypium gossypioides]